MLVYLKQVSLSLSNNHQSFLILDSPFYLLKTNSCPKSYWSHRIRSHSHPHLAPNWRIPTLTDLNTLKHRFELISSTQVQS